MRLRTWNEGREGKLEGRFFSCYESSDNKSDSFKKKNVIEEKNCSVSRRRKKTQAAGDLHSLLR